MAFYNIDLICYKYQYEISEHNIHGMTGNNLLIISNL